AYRSTLLREATGRDIPAGHVRPPALEPGGGDPAALTDPGFERDRADITEQLRAIVTAAVRTAPLRCPASCPSRARRTRGRPERVRPGPEDRPPPCPWRGGRRAGARGHGRS